MRKPLIIILSAGMGSRLGRPYPKVLAMLNDSETIFSRQLRIFREFGLTVMVVVGFKKDLIMEADPDVLYAYNAVFDTTNTSKSLLCGLQHIRNQDVLWINGDVVFEPAIIRQMLQQSGSLVAVNNATVGDEEVKYEVSEGGYIRAISKDVVHPRGEALGINLIEASHLEKFKHHLESVDDQDYFERGMELLIQESGTVFSPMNVGEQVCIEVDFREDLEQARLMIAKNSRGQEYR